MGNKANSRWTEETIIEVSKDRDLALDKLVKSISKMQGVVFAAKLGFGVPRIDIATIASNRTVTGYVLKLPVVDGKINTLPYFQGFGESIFLCDQMLDESYLLLPDMVLNDNNPFTRSPDPLYRLRKQTYESGICVFDSEFNVKILREPKGSLTKQYQRLKFELFEYINSFGEMVVSEGKEDAVKEWNDWFESEHEKLGNKRYMDEASAKAIVKQTLEQKNYRSITMSIKESEIKTEPRPIPIFEVSGSGFYLGSDTEFSLQLSRISGVVLGGNF